MAAQIYPNRLKNARRGRRRIRYHSSVHLATDYIHSTPGRGRCRVRIYLPHDEMDAPVVICSEVPNNPGASVTQAAEVIAGEVISFHGLPKKPVWIEHHPPEATGGSSETFDLVLFSSHEVSEVLVGGEWRKEIGVPAWKRLDRQAVEVLVGEEV